MAKRKPRNVFEEADLEAGGEYGELEGTFPKSFVNAIKAGADTRLDVGASRMDHMSDQFDETPDCPTCGGPSTPLGQLGSRSHYRCRNCGMDHSSQ